MFLTRSEDYEVIVFFCPDILLHLEILHSRLVPAVLVRKNGFFRLGVHTNAFAIASDSVVLSSFLIIITSVTIPVSLCLHSMCWCPRRGLVFLVWRLYFLLFANVPKSLRRGRQCLGSFFCFIHRFKQDEYLEGDWII